jgi:hypothetical protein
LFFGKKEITGADTNGGLMGKDSGGAGRKKMVAINRYTSCKMNK